MRQPAFCRFSRLWLLCVPLVLFFSSCASSYRQNIMLRVPTGIGVDTMKLRAMTNRVSRNYVIQPNDFLDVRVYTNKGERILDPNGELQFGAPGGRTGVSSSSALSRGQAGQNIGGIGGGGQQGGVQGGSALTSGSEFLVQADGQVKLPMVNQVSVAGLTLLQADSLLQVRYSEFYRDVFVTSRVTNNRIVVLGSPGGRIVPMYNDNMNLLEVLAAVGGVGASGGIGAAGGAGAGVGRASNIRLIRGDLKNPQVQVIDLTTIEGMRRASLRVEPNDIVYIEPVRRPFFEAANDASTILGIIGGITGLITSLYLVTKI